MTDYPMMVLICEGSGFIPGEVHRTPSGRKSRSRMPSMIVAPIAPIEQVLAVAYFPSPTPKYMFTNRGGALECFMEGRATLTTAPALRSGKATFFQIVDYNLVQIQGGVASGLPGQDQGVATSVDPRKAGDVGWSLEWFLQTHGRAVAAGECLQLRSVDAIGFQVFIK